MDRTQRLQRSGTGNWRQSRNRYRLQRSLLRGDRFTLVSRARRASPRTASFRAVETARAAGSSPEPVDCSRDLVSRAEPTVSAHWSSFSGCSAGRSLCEVRQTCECRGIGHLIAQLACTSSAVASGARQRWRNKPGRSPGLSRATHASSQGPSRKRLHLIGRRIKAERPQQFEIAQHGLVVECKLSLCGVSQSDVRQLAREREGQAPFVRQNVDQATADDEVWPNGKSFKGRGERTRNAPDVKLRRQIRLLTTV